MEKIEVFIPKKDYEKLNKVKHHKKKEWVKLIYYENRKEKFVFPDEVINFYKACDVYKKNCFYKICALSNKDNTWDYYRKLKTDVSNKEYIGIEERVNKKRKKKTVPFSIQHFPNGKILTWD